MKAILFPAIAGALVAMSGAALAETAVSAVTDLNVRAGPGPQYPVIGVLAAGQSATTPRLHCKQQMVHHRRGQWPGLGLFGLCNGRFRRQSGGADPPAG